MQFLASCQSASGVSSLPSGDGTTSDAAAATFTLAIVFIPAHKLQSQQLHAPLAFIELSGFYFLMQLSSSAEGEDALISPCEIKLQETRWQVLPHSVVRSLETLDFRPILPNQITTSLGISLWYITLWNCHYIHYNIFIFICGENSMLSPVFTASS